MEEAKVMTLKEALEWCDLDSKTRVKPVYQEYVRTWTNEKEVVIERINPDEDFMSADIIGYNKTNRLWTKKPTKLQRDSIPMKKESEWTWEQEQVKSLKYVRTENKKDKDGEYKVYIMAAGGKEYEFFTDPIQCADCPYCDFCGGEWADCELTNEKLWHIFSSIGEKCPMPFPKE
jgi:hypothetical protein